MSAAGLDKYCSEGFYGDCFAVKLHLARAFEDEVNLGELGLSGLTKARLEKPHGHFTASISSKLAII
jgi:hypothetical protein